MWYSNKMCSHLCLVNKFIYITIEFVPYLYSLVVCLPCPWWRCKVPSPCPFSVEPPAALVPPGRYLLCETVSHCESHGNVCNVKVLCNSSKNQKHFSFLHFFNTKTFIFLMFRNHMAL